jgi:hypothetical protein
MARYVLLNGVRFVRILNSAEYNRKEVVKLLEKELGWVDYGGKHYESIFTRFFQGYILPKKFGIDKRRAHFSSMICSGQMTREQALQEIQTEPYDAALMRDDLEYVAKKFGLSNEAFEQLMKAPPKKHTDYPSYSYLFDGGGKKLMTYAKRIALGY